MFWRALLSKSSVWWQSFWNILPAIMNEPVNQCQISICISMLLYKRLWRRWKYSSPISTDTCQSPVAGYTDDWSLHVMWAKTIFSTHLIIAFSSCKLTIVFYHITVKGSFLQDCNLLLHLMGCDCESYLRKLHSRHCKTIKSCIIIAFQFVPRKLNGLKPSIMRQLIRKLLQSIVLLTLVINLPWNNLFKKTSFRFSLLKKVCHYLKAYGICLFQVLYSREVNI